MATPKVKPEDRKKLGRPSKYNTALANKICELVASGMTLTNVCMADGMPNRSTVVQWVHLYPEFSNDYTRAQRSSADAIFDGLGNMLDNPERSITTGEISRSWVQWQTLNMKIIAMRLKHLHPSKYGDKIQTVHSGSLEVKNVLVKYV